MRQKILVIVGPNAVGKSALAVNLAKKFNGEIISADSRQIYKGLDIGSGKITKKEMCGIPHHMLDVADPKKQFTVAEYRKQAVDLLRCVETKKKFPIIVGGTGFYIDNLVENITLPDVPPNQKLRKKLWKKSTQTLFSILKKIDSRRARTIDPKNKVRIIRAIEIARALGKVPNVANNRINNKYVFIGLTLPNEILKKNIKKRLDERVKGGMISEARKLHKNGLSWKRMNELGLEYRYLALYLQNKISKLEMTNQIFKQSYQYAKRQYTWFKRNKKINWFQPREKKKIERFVRTKIAVKS